MIYKLYGQTGKQLSAIGFGGMRLPDPQNHDAGIAILSAGAYGMTMASNYNTRPLPAEILVEGSKATVVRERQTLDDVLKGEHIA